MQTKREYAIAKGLARPGRGRLGREAWAAIEEAKKKGIKFSDSNAERARARAEALERREAERDERAKARAEKENTGILATKPPRPDRPRGIYVFQNPDGTTFKRSQATACVECSYSIPWCYCLQGPTLFIYPHRPGMWEERAVMVQIPKAVITTADVPEKQPQQGTRKTRRKGK